MSASIRSRRRSLVVRVGLSTLLAAGLACAPSPQQGPRAVQEGYIGGTVNSSQGPEAGVWVIAETKDLPTPFVKIVVTDDEGLFVLPDLPDASYRVWVRGYGLVDSKPLQAKPGDDALALTATVAGSPKEAAKVYPGNYWLSLLEPPAKGEFPGTGPKGNGISPRMMSQSEWINNLKDNCGLCHQLGNEVTRTLTHLADKNFASSKEAWAYRVQLGVRGGEMNGGFYRFGRERALHLFSDWTDRIAAGEVPPTPLRPKGIERNLVVTLWDWGHETSYMHDEITTDKNNPTVNANGPVYAVSSGHGMLTVLDPLGHTTQELEIPTREDPSKVPTRFPPPAEPSNFYGNRHLWGEEHPSDPHNPMMDNKGRVWMTSKIRANANPAWCRDGSLNKFAAYFPLQRSTRQASYYDPASREFTLLDTCFTTHHLQFGTDPDQTLYFNGLGGNPVTGWINTRQFDQRGNEQASQGWCPQVLDTNADGKITKPWNEPGKPVDPSRDTRVSHELYAVIPNPVDDTVWGASSTQSWQDKVRSFPGHILRLDRGNNPPETCVTELYRVPDPGFDPRGIDIDTNGVIWTALAGSSHLASFDRRKCKVLNGPTTSEGTHCPDGWTLYKTDGPTLKGTDVPADMHYYNWVDQHNTSGLGKNLPIATGTFSDSLLVLRPETKEWIRLRVPYPLGFFHRGLDGRIDDPNAGWKGRALWANYGTHLLWHVEGGKGTTGKMVRFQVRPDPLAK